MLTVLVISSAAAAVACDAADQPMVPATTPVPAAAPDRTAPTATGTVVAPTLGSVTRPMSATTPDTDTEATHGASPDGGGLLEHPSGLELTYPPGWSSTGPVIATEFSVGATCVAVQVVDFEPPTDPDAAEAGATLTSVVQVCARPSGGKSLDEFMSSTYGGTSAFSQVDLGGTHAYRAGDELQATYLLQGSESTYEILTSVVADVTLEPQRIHEVEEVLRSVGFD